MRKAALRCGGDMPDIYCKNAWFILKIYLRYACGIFEIYPRHAWWLWYDRDMPEIYVR